jgi:UDP-N-acetylglucosamine 2-epimerase
LQKEAYFAKKHSCVIMPDTGAPELIICKWNSLCNENNLFEVFKRNFKRSHIGGIYGKGKAGENIVKILKNILL